MSLLAVAVGSQIAGGLLGAYGSYKQGKAQEDAYGRQVSLSSLRQKEIARRAELQKNIMKRESRGRLSSAKAIQAGQGFSLDGFTTGKTELSFEDQLARDIEMLNQETTYQMMLEQAGESEALLAAKESRRAGKLGALTSILGGGTSGLSTYMTYKNVGAGGSMASNRNRNYALESDRRD